MLSYHLSYLQVTLHIHFSYGEHYQFRTSLGRNLISSLLALHLNQPRLYFILRLSWMKQSIVMTNATAIDFATEMSGGEVNCCCLIGFFEIVERMTYSVGDDDNALFASFLLAEDFPVIDCCSSLFLSFDF